MASLFDWSSTAANNTAVDSININTGMSPANVDNALRSIMALIRATFSSGLQTFLAGSSALPVANGGTGATTAAGVLTAIGALADTYRDLPITTKSSSFTLADTDRATALNYTGSGGTATIDPNSTTAITTGATIVVRNAGSGNLTITRGSGVTLKSNGSTTSANATLAAGGVCTLVKWGTNDWSCTGSGLS
jgi:hypothetical protein